MYSSLFFFSGLADNFPTFNDNTVVVTPLNGLFDPNPSICPQIPDMESDTFIADESGGEDLDSQKQQQRTEKEAPISTSFLQSYLRSYLPTTFRHCPKAQLGLNSMNMTTGLKMIISSDDDELYLRYREGYDDTRWENWLARVFIF